MNNTQLQRGWLVFILVAFPVLAAAWLWRWWPYPVASRAEDPDLARSGLQWGGLALAAALVMAFPAIRKLGERLLPVLAILIGHALLWWLLVSVAVGMAQMLAPGSRAWTVAAIAAATAAIILLLARRVIWGGNFQRRATIVSEQQSG